MRGRPCLAGGGKQAGPATAGPSCCRDTVVDKGIDVGAWHWRKGCLECWDRHACHQSTQASGWRLLFHLVAPAIRLAVQNKSCLYTRVSAQRSANRAYAWASFADVVLMMGGVTRRACTGACMHADVSDVCMEIVKDRPPHTHPSKAHLTRI